jgi:hypothetical protein
MPAAFLGLTMLTIDLNDQLQRHATGIDGVRRYGVLTTKTPDIENGHCATSAPRLAKTRRR